MGELANILRSNLRELARSHSRTLRGIDAELKAAKGSEFVPSQLNQRDLLKNLLGPGTFMQQNKKTLQALGKKHGIKKFRNKSFSQLNKADLSTALKERNVGPPPRHVENLSKKELVYSFNKLLDLSIKLESHLI